MKSQSRKWIETQRDLLSPLKFARDMMCDWGSVEDQFYYAFNKSMLVAETKDRGKELYSFHDFNKRVMCAIIAQVVGESHTRTGTLEILKSYAIPECGTEQLAQKIREDFPKREIKSFMDMSGSDLNRDTTSVFGVTDKTILEQYGFRIQNSKRSMPRIGDTDNSSNAFINQRRLLVPIYETKVVDALETFHYVDGNRKELVKYSEVKSAHIDGLGDCLRYGIHFLFPMNHTQEHHVDTYIDSDMRHQSVPGQEYIDNYDYDPDTGQQTKESIIREMLKEVQPDEEYWC